MVLVLMIPKMALLPAEDPKAVGSAVCPVWEKKERAPWGTLKPKA